MKTNSNWKLFLPIAKNGIIAYTQFVCTYIYKWNNNVKCSTILRIITAVNYILPRTQACIESDGGAFKCKLKSFKNRLNR